MRQKVKKQVAMLLCMIMLLSCAAGSWQVNAESSLGAYIEISNLQSTSVTCSWLPLVDAYKAEGKIIECVKVTLSSIGRQDQILAESTTKGGVNLWYLQPGEYYQIIVEPTYHLLEDEANATYQTYTGYEWNSFTTLSADTTATPAVTTQAPAATTQTPAAVTQTPQATTQAPAALTVSSPKVTKAKLIDTKLALQANAVTASGYEFRVCTKKGKVVKRESVSSTGTVISNVPANKVYYAQVRAYDYDANYNKVYSSWSNKKYFIAQPTINTDTSKVNKHSISLKWNKVKNASSYTVYMKKTTSNKWIKVKTTKKNSYTVNKLKGVTIDAVANDYNVRVIANAKVKGKSIKSDKSKYIKTYTYYY